MHIEKSDFSRPMTINVGYTGTDLLLHNIQILETDSGSTIISSDTVLRYKHKSDSLSISTFRFEFDTTLEYGSSIQFIYYANIDPAFSHLYFDKLQKLKAGYINDISSSIAFKKRKVDFQIIDSFLIEGIYEDLVCIRNSNILYKGGGSSAVSKGFITMKIEDFSDLQKSAFIDLSDYKRRGLTINELRNYIDSPSSGFYNFESDKFRISYSSHRLNLTGYKTTISDWQLQKIFEEDLKLPDELISIKELNIPDDCKVLYVSRN